MVMDIADTPQLIKLSSNEELQPKKESEPKEEPNPIKEPNEEPKMKVMDGSYTRIRKIYPINSGYGYEKLEEKQIWDGYAKSGYGAGMGMGLGITRPILVPAL